MIPDEKDIPDVDLDVAYYDKALAALSGYVVASENTNGKLTKHKNGIYFQQVPVDPETGFSAFPYQEAEELNYYKIDILHVRVYEMVKSEELLQQLLEEPVNWEWFLDERFFENDDGRYRLTHLANHHYLCEMYPPKSVEDVAILLAVIRPRKSYLIGQSWERIKELIWKKLPEENPNNEAKKYHFKKSHGIAYALLVTLHARLIAKYLNGEELEESEFFV